MATSINTNNVTCRSTIDMKAVSEKIYSTISRLQIDEGAKAHYRTKAKQYSHECGCSFAGTCLVIASAATVLYWLVFDHLLLSPLQTVLSLILVALFGKVFGIGIGRLRLLILLRTIESLNGRKWSVYGIV